MLVLLFNAYSQPSPQNFHNCFHTLHLAFLEGHLEPPASLSLETHAAHLCYHPHTDTVLAMPRKVDRSLLFCEWAAGTTIPSILGPLPKKKPKRRGVVKVEVTTDDESEEDSLKITYPRAETSSRSPKSVVKKVRFEEAPPKSALKQTVVIATESDDASSVAEAEPSSDTSELPTPPKSKKSRKKVVEDTSSDEASVASSDKETPSASSGTDGDSQRPKKQKNPKCEKQPDTSEADDEASESAGESEEEIVIVKKNKQKKGKGKQQEPKKKSSKEEDSSKDETEETKSSQSENQADTDRANNQKPKVRSKRDDQGSKAALYPEAFPASHSRRPNLIEPIRAEVVQTERVVETPEDPPPNAFFDTDHNIIRVYYGPVYGNHHGRSLYPKRDPSNRPLPIGMPHPSQNLYLHGFNVSGASAPVPQNTPAQAPLTQGMPPGPWGAMYPPPPWYASAYPGGPVQGGETGPAEPDQGGSKGVFSMQNGNSGRSASSNMKNKDGANNVGPGSVKGLEDNPYIPKRYKSQFSTYGSNRSASAASQQGGKANSWRQSNNGNDGAGDQQPAANDQQWGNQAQDGNTWNNPEPPHNAWENNNAQQDTWNNGDTAQTDAWGNATGNSNTNGNDWENNAEQNNSAANAGESNTWENNQTQQVDHTNDTQPDAWGQGPAVDSSLPTTDNNNVGPPLPMPGAWQETAPVPSWGDPTMAADTHGKIETW
ncbi:hypothetical protein HJFPF1_03630 [Paramyrothecium foliicola]|nr:hypothetical protein HJFPF1_03630 [Paramyrothecium foliicola]